MSYPDPPQSKRVRMRFLRARIHFIRGNADESYCAGAYFGVSAKNRSSSSMGIPEIARFARPAPELATPAFSLVFADDAIR